MFQKHQKGFTLVELLVVIAIVGVLVAVIFVALDPATRFQQARDSVRQNDVQEVLSAVKLHQVDNDGSYLAAIAGATVDQVYMLGTGMALGCDDNNGSCDTAVSSDTHCLNVSGLVTGGYLDAMPISPAGAVTWDDGSAAGEEGSGYTLERETSGIIRIRSCESEYTGNAEIEVAR